jgi:hypothetical protein
MSGRGLTEEGVPFEEVVGQMFGAPDDVERLCDERARRPSVESDALIDSTSPPKATGEAGTPLLSRVALSVLHCRATKSRRQ